MRARPIVMHYGNDFDSDDQFLRDQYDKTQNQNGK